MVCRVMALTKQKLGGKCLIWADVGIKWQQQYPSLEDFFTEHYLRGLLQDGKIEGIMVEAPPVEDMSHRKEMVSWTREKIVELLSN